MIGGFRVIGCKENYKLYLSVGLVPAVSMVLFNIDDLIWRGYYTLANSQKGIDWTFIFTHRGQVLFFGQRYRIEDHPTIIYLAVLEIQA